MELNDVYIFKDGRFGVVVSKVYNLQQEQDTYYVMVNGEVEIVMQ